MIIKSPLCITGRLLPGVKIGEATISIEYAGELVDEIRQRYRWFIDLGVVGLGESFQGDDLFSGQGGGTLQGGLESLFSFLSAFSEAHAYQDQTGQECENADLFSHALAEWAVAHKDEIGVLECDLSENPGAYIIEEGE